MFQQVELFDELRVRDLVCKIFVLIRHCDLMDEGDLQLAASQSRSMDSTLANTF